MTAAVIDPERAQELDDAGLIGLSLDEPEWFSVLFDRHGHRIHEYAARRLGAQAAEDIVAETFFAAFRRRHSYDRTRPLARPWLYGIATNLIARHRRTEERYYRVLQRTGEDPLAEPLDDAVLERVTAQQKEKLLAGALGRLSRGDRDVLLLIAWGDLTYEEVADALGLRVGTVRSRLHRARRKVRTALAEADPMTRKDGEQR
ncbi:RNA polymerase sigma factor [Actinomadura graeca]|uniref:RNA polymerase sigma factor n=1 Tax=Actinomadura graeca TaxID=2750812 RepID=A0ABX8QX85_9ACTN|nr:RNA polymerase sigma factor [Actinomadura graeca]QXJ23375.1 RNA polymerase sigma factor [Actinomadura graeca]